MWTLVSNLLLCTLYLVYFNTGLIYSQDHNCNPYDNCAASTIGKKVPDPADCHNFYVCISDTQGNSVPSDTSIACNNSYYFRYEFQECVSGPCNNTCINICAAECINYDYERIADTTNCSNFYTCEPGEIKVKYSCPDDTLFFDGLYCTTDKFSCCDTCIPYCQQQYTEIANPYDCNSYYLCLQTGIPPESEINQCAPGQYFDTTVGTCQEETIPCQSFCVNETTGITTRSY